MNVKENGKTYKYLLNNPEFNAYLKIVKKDSKTNQTVLKAGITYQIYKVDKEWQGRPCDTDTQQWKCNRGCGQICNR